MGWISVHRELMKKPIWLNSSPEHKCILITLLLMANHERGQWEWMGQKFKVNPGQFVTSIEGIKSHCGKGISFQNIRSALKRFENLEFLTNESTKCGRLITILNYESYQTEKRTGNKDTNKGVTKEQQRGNKEVTTNNKDNNDNKISIEELKKYYRKEIELSKVDKEYVSFVWFLFETNDTGKPLEKVLYMDDPITWENYQILNRKIGIIKDHGKSAETIKHKIMSLEDSNKKYTKCFRTINNWFVREAKQYGIDLPDNDEFRKAIRQ